ncbi:GTP cyclohydrolase I [Mycobacterium kubicae]|uniref:GTP cyclohydrolase I n=1 Tax=Mycobacterium kubicae TaxID=120959 RepID=UPI0009EDFDC2|nr:GTP cyclohydrolase I [Mycobacterium kubicae]
MLVAEAINTTQTVESPAWYEDNADMAVELAMQQLLDALGVNEGEHTARTPVSGARAWRDLLWGYDEVPEDHLETHLPAADEPGLIVMHGIAFTSTCVHHLMPFSGTATIAYRPRRGQRVVDTAGLARLVHGYAARLQVQERIGHQAAAALMRKLDPSGVMVVITTRHDCLSAGQSRVPTAEVTTEARKGTWAADEIARVRSLHVG